MITRRQFQVSALGAGAAFAVGNPADAQQSPRRRLIVDAQVHMWLANTPDRPWTPGAQAQLPEPMTIERLVPLMDAADVDRVLIVPPTLEGIRYDYGQEAARRYPGRFATMARVNLDNPQEANRIGSLKQKPAVMGIRMYFQPAQAKWLLDGTADWFWPVAEKAGLPVMFLTIGQTPLFSSIAERHPGLKLIVDHMGLTDTVLKDNSTPERVREVAALSKFQNVSVKLSSSPLFSAESYPWRDMNDHIRMLFEAFGPNRCHWGTDLTNTFSKGPYRQRVTHFTEELTFLSEGDKDLIMGKSLMDVLGWA